MAFDLSCSVGGLVELLKFILFEQLLHLVRYLAPFIILLVCIQKDGWILALLTSLLWLFVPLVYQWSPRNVIPDDIHHALSDDFIQVLNFFYCLQGCRRLPYVRLFYLGGHIVEVHV